MIQFIPDQLRIFIFWFALSVISIYVRPLFPVDETRYASVAWEMWIRDDFLVPYLNGEAYSHKPPLLFWLMQISWWLFGVNEYTIRLIGPLFALGVLVLTGKISRKLWPDREQAGYQTAYILMGFFIWMLYATLMMFDMILAFFVLLGIYSLIRPAGDGVVWKNWGIMGLAIAGGALTKGPVILLHLLPVSLLAPWWRQEQHHDFKWWQWYVGIVFAVCVGVTLALCWAIPAGKSGGELYRQAIFFGQTSGRVVNSFAHRLPWWWYLQNLPFLLMPWFLWKKFWKGTVRLNLKDQGIRFCFAWLVPVLIAFSLISGKRIHYLLPLIPGFSMLLFRGVDDVKEHSRVVLLSMIYLVMGTVVLLLPVLNDHWQWQPDLSLISPVWGILIMVIAVILFLSSTSKHNTVLLIALSSLAVFLVLECSFFSVAGYRYDMQPAALRVAALQREGKALVFFGAKYHGEFNFTGRLKKPLIVIKDKNKLMKWVEDHPNDYVIRVYRRSETDYQRHEHFPDKGKYMVFLTAEEIRSHSVVIP